MALSVIVDGVDLVAEGIVDEDTVSDSDNVRGFDVASFSAHGLPHIRAHNVLQLGAAVEIIRNGFTTFEGKIADIDDLQSPHEVTCEGIWERLKRRSDVVYLPIESRCDQWREIPVGLVDDTWAGKQANFAVVDTEGQVLLSWPDGSPAKTGMSTILGLCPLEQLASGWEIRRVVCDFSAYMGGYEGGGFYFVPDMYSPISSEVAVVSAGTTSTCAGPAGSTNIHIDSTVGAGSGYRALRLRLTGATGTLSAESYFQLRNLTVYLGRTDSPSPTTAIAELAVQTGLAASSSMESAGTAPNSPAPPIKGTRAELIEGWRSLISSVYDIAFWDNAVCFGTVRPTSPPYESKHLAIRSGDLADPSDWSVRIPPENRIDAVCATYEFEPANMVATPSPTSASWPGDWTRSSGNCTVFDAGGGDYWFRAAAAAGDWNPFCYAVATGIVPGRRYLGRGFLAVDPWDSGTAYLYISWRNSGGTEIGTSNVMARTGSALTVRWLEATGVAPAGATQAYMVIIWIGHAASGGASIFGKHIQLLDATPAGTERRVYYPSEPSAADARVATYSLGRCSDAAALAAATNAYLQTVDKPSGQLRLDGRKLETISGSPVDPMQIRSLDWWASKMDALDADDRGPFIVTSADRSGDGTVTLGFDGDAYSPPGFEHPAAKGRYIGAHRVRRRYMKRVSYAQYWKWRHRNKKKLPAMPSKHPKYGRVPAWRWVDVDASYR